MEKKKEEEGLAVGLAIIGNWFWRKISLRKRLKKGIALVVVGGIFFFFLSQAKEQTDKFWGSIFGVTSQGEVYFPWFGIILTLASIYVLGIVTEIINFLTTTGANFVKTVINIVTPRKIKNWAEKNDLRAKLSGKIPGWAKTTWNFIFEENEGEEDLDNIRKGQPVLIRTYGPEGLLELAIVAGTVEIETLAGEIPRLWKVAKFSPPIVVSGGGLGFAEAHHIEYVIEMDWLEIMNYYATFGANTRKRFKELNKKLIGIEEVKSEDLPRGKKKIRTRRGLTKALSGS